ncbi:MAG: Rieske (2Fe-2S) protein [Candidatus Obscuribacter sp.]|nr:Rieske (2Fe-2S) protein [Candidatus Obscuribacter sp.]
MEDNAATKIEEEDKSSENPEAGDSHAETDSHWDLDILGEGQVGRGTMMRTAMGGIALLWGGMTLYPIYSYLKPKASDKDEQTKVTSLEVCKVDELPKGSGRNFRFGSTPALVIHTPDGEIHAFKAICTHLGCTVQYRNDKDAIWCACHGGQYDSHSGKNVAGPPPKPLAPLKAEVVNGKIVVSQA